MDGGTFFVETNATARIYLFSTLIQPAPSILGLIWAILLKNAPVESGSSDAAEETVTAKEGLKQD